MNTQLRHYPIMLQKRLLNLIGYKMYMPATLSLRRSLCTVCNRRIRNHHHHSSPPQSTFRRFLDNCMSGSGHKVHCNKKESKKYHSGRGNFVALSECRLLFDFTIRNSTLIVLPICHLKSAQNALQNSGVSKGPRNPNSVLKRSLMSLEDT